MKPQLSVLRSRLLLHVIRRSLHFGWGLLFLFGLFLTIGCSDDISDVEATAKMYEPARETGENIELLYTENGHTRVKLTAPRIVSHKQKEPFIEFPSGLFVRFYDEVDNETSTLKADYAIRYVQKEETFFRDNVEIENEAGEQLFTDELIWDENEERIYSEKFVRIITPEERISGHGFEADQEFTVYQIKEITGQVYVESNETDEDL